MTQSFHGKPCWFELATTDLNAAKDFYAAILGWQTGASAMPDFDYRLAKSGDDMVAGMMSLSQLPPGTPPNWMTYFGVDDCDKAANQVKADGGKLFKDPQDIPGTGRFAVCADPQGAVFGLLQPDMSAMSAADLAKVEAGAGAFNATKPGHGAWVELMTTDPKAAFAFYEKLLGWKSGRTVPMDDAGDYSLFQWQGTDIGGMMGLGNAPMPVWLPYFGVKSAEVAKTAIGANGGDVKFGPMEVPGGAFTLVSTDPQGAWFATVGGK